MIIQALKESLGIFKRDQVTSLNWPPVLIDDEVKCSIDDEEVDCEKLQEDYEQEPYTGVPAPVYLEYDPWFAPPVYSEKQITVKEAYEHAVADNQILHETLSSEPQDIHEKIYQIATGNWNTVDETKETIGGSENYHTGPGGWNSGNGWGTLFNG
jgi:hypothetical protein